MSAVSQSSPESLEFSEGDDFHPVPSAFEEITGHRPHPTTCCRWAKKGAAGIILPTQFVAGRRMTTLAAAAAWLRAVTAKRNAR